MFEPPDSETLWTNEKIVAYRGWNWDRGSLKGNYDFWTRSRMEATHLGDGDLHDSPDWECLCGINAFKEVHYASEDYPILGQIELSGKVIEYDAGYRAAIGEIIHIAVWDRYLDVAPFYLTLDQIRQKYPDVIVTAERKIPWRT